MYEVLARHTYFNNHRTHTSREGRTPDTPVSRPIANLRSFRWQPTADPCIRPQWLPDSLEDSGSLRHAVNL